MKAGVSRRDITPPIRTRLADHTRYSTGIHDPLFVKPLVLDDGENAVAIVCLDLLNGSLEFCDQMRKQIQKRTGIKHTLINFSQTHEPFCEYELWVDEEAPFEHTMVFGDTNGMVTYVATDQDLALGEKGGYEAGSFPSLWAHNVRVLHTSLAVGIEGMIKEGIASLWTD